MKLPFTIGKVKLPSSVTLVLSAALGILSGLNVATFGLGAPWTQLVTFGCAALAAVGITPLAHQALRNVLHLTYPAALSIGGALTTLCAGITAASMNVTVKGVLVGLVTAAVGALVGPSDAPAAPAK